MNKLYSKKIDAYIKKSRLLIEKQFDEALETFGKENKEFISGGKKQKSGGQELNQSLELIKKQLLNLNEIQTIARQSVEGEK